MHPDANLTKQREIFALLDSGDIDTDDLLVLAKLTKALDDWITNGGFLPGDWTDF